MSKKKIIIIVLTIILLVIITSAIIYLSKQMSIAKKLITAYDAEDYIMFDNTGYYDLQLTSFLGEHEKKITTMSEMFCVYRNWKYGSKYEYISVNKPLFAMIILRHAIPIIDTSKEISCYDSAEKTVKEVGTWYEANGYDIEEELTSNYDENKQNSGFKEMRALGDEKVYENIRKIASLISFDDVQREKDKIETQKQKEYNEKNPLVLKDGILSKRGDYCYYNATISNVGSKTYKSIKVKVIYYDILGNVLTTDWTYAVDSVGIKPNENIQFEVMTKVTGNVSSCSASIIDYR